METVFCLFVLLVLGFFCMFTSVLDCSFSELNVFSCIVYLEKSNWFHVARGWNAGRSEKNSKLKNSIEALLGRLRPVWLIIRKQ